MVAINEWDYFAAHSGIAWGDARHILSLQPEPGLEITGPMIVEMLAEMNGRYADEMMRRRSKWTSK